MRKKYNLLFALIIGWVISCSLALAAENYKYALGTFDLVDSGKHLDWGGSSNYMTQWYDAVNTWNGYKSGVIRADTWRTIKDVTISDKEAYNGSTFAITYSSGKIVFFQELMDGMTATQRQATITHEIGHALGLDHNEKATSVMRQGYKNFTALDQIDKEGYDAAYRRY